MKKKGDSSSPQPTSDTSSCISQSNSSSSSSSSLLQSQLKAALKINEAAATLPDSKHNEGSHEVLLRR